MMHVFSVLRLAPPALMFLLMACGARGPAHFRRNEGGREGTLEDFRGSVVVLNVWASWCDPCVDELPLLQRTQERIQAQGATLLGVNTKDFTDEALAMERRFKLTFPSLCDRDGTFVREYGTTAYPETFVIDRQGRVAAKRRGPVDAAWLDETLPAIIREKA